MFLSVARENYPNKRMHDFAILMWIYRLLLKRAWNEKLISKAEAGDMVRPNAAEIVFVYFGMDGDE
jgi:hypothetical protein